MAKELTLGGSAAFSKGGASETYGYSGKTVDVSGARYYKGIQTVGTSEEALVKGELGTVGFSLIKNLDATNFCLILMETGDTVGVKVGPGESAGPMRLPAAPFLKADTAPVNLEVFLVEN